jgi:hypothetical protein
MTLLQYLLSTGVATSAELIALSKVDRPGYDTIRRWAKEQAAHNGIAIEEKQ